MKKVFKVTESSGRLLPIMMVALMVASASAAFFAKDARCGVLDRIVAVVNDDIITLKDLDGAVAPFLTRLKAQGYSQEKEEALLSQLRTKMLDKLVDEKLTEQEFVKAGISVSEEEIDQYVERFKAGNQLSDEALEQGLARDGITMKEFRRRIRMQLLRPRLINREVNSKVVITDEDVVKYFNENKSRYAGIEKIHLRNIIMFVPAGTGAEEKKKVRMRMEEVYDRLKQGEGFADLASQYTESDLRAEGGDIGEFLLDELSPMLQKELQGRETGFFTNVLDTEQGFQMFFVENKSMTSGKTLAEVKPEISEILYKERVDAKFKTWLSELRQNSFVQIME